MTQEPTKRSTLWKWSVCGLLLLATMLNYMDRQTLAQTATDIQHELHLNDAHYGNLEMGFGFAFAAGCLCMGLLADRVTILILYPCVLIAWSLAGFSTAYAYEIGALLGFQTTTDKAYYGFMFCRIALGFFEAGQWPCALVTTARLLSREDRTLGNSILQSGASLGAIFTPLVIQMMSTHHWWAPAQAAGLAGHPGGPGVSGLLLPASIHGMSTSEPGSWRLPFQIIGLVGMFWVVPWFILVRARDLAHRPAVVSSTGVAVPDLPTSIFWRRLIACLVTVIAINLTWQFFRAWLPKFLRDYHDYERGFVNYFTSAYYLSTDVGCIAAGIAVRYLASRGWDVHTARITTFSTCALLLAGSMAIAFLPAGPLLLGLLLLVGAATLGFFPNYYAFTQDLSPRHQGKVTGTLGFLTWMASGFMQGAVGQYIESTKSYREVIILACLVPLAAALAIILLWRSGPRHAEH